MASLRDLPLPPEDANHCLNWDETIGGNSSRPSWEHPSLCSHAMAHGSFVYGIDSSSSDDWITWKTSFAPHQVCRVASNQDGSILVASTNGGTVSLLRARDGKILATRRVCTSEGTSRPAEVSYVKNAHRHQSKDVLIILVPTADQLANENAADVNVILVSNIDGERLNQDEVESVAEAAKSMSIDALKLNAPCKDFEALEGCYLNASTVRFAAGDADGNVSIHDYNVENKQAVLVSKQIQARDVDAQEQTLLTSLGMRLQHSGNDSMFLVLCGHSNHETRLYWYDLVHLNMACDCILPLPTRKTTKPWLLAIEPVFSFSNDSAMAVAVAMKESAAASDGFVQVLQVHAEETMGLTVLSSPHKVYQIPLKTSQESNKTSLSGVDLDASPEAGPYSFRFKANYGSDCSVCCEFVTRHSGVESGVMGIIRLLLQREMFDEADELLAANDCKLLSSDPYAMFHSSEVALRRLQRLLLSENIGSEESMERARECLRRLTAGAVSSNETGQQYLLEAADSVMLWPTNAGNSRLPTIDEYSMSLSAMAAAIQTALQPANPVFGTQLTDMKKELDDRLSAMKCIVDLLETDSMSIVLGSPFLESRTPSDIFLVLVGEGFFSVAERFWRSKWGQYLTAEISASAILSLSPVQDPRAYAAVLKDVLLPKLAISHEAIPLIRSWACRSANAYDDDDNEFGLEASIFLLQTVLSGIQQLNLQIHSSYASYSPFVETKPKKGRQPSPRNGLLDVTSSSYSSEGSAPSDQRRSAETSATIAVNQHPTPTVLEMGFLKSGAMKSKLRSLPTRRSGDAVSFEEDEADDGEDCIEVKLKHANLLERARELGLPRSVVSLRDYLKLGGSERVGKELVRVYSSSAAGHDERYLALRSKVKPFCDAAGVDYDQILVAYNVDLCDSKQTSVQALLESSSIARCCFAPVVKCQVALAVLRVALLCGKKPACLAELSELSRDSIAWAAVDTAIKSELEEATRLLVVDGIVRKYCGTGARELFRVDNPLHAVRLLDFVCRHFTTSSVLSDVFALCDAFTFLTRDDACVSVIERAVTYGDVDLCVELLNTVLALGYPIADGVSRRVIDYCCHELEETCSAMSNVEVHFRQDILNGKAESACKVSCAIAEVCHEHFRSNLSSTAVLQFSFSSLLQNFNRLQRLQEHHDLFLPLSVLNSESAIIQTCRSVLKPVVQAFQEGNTKKGASFMMRAKAACAILVDTIGLDCQSIWYVVAGEAASSLASGTSDGQCIDFLAAAGILDDYDNEDAIRAILSVAFRLCCRASCDVFRDDAASDNCTLIRMEDVIRASSLVHDYALIGCPECMVETLVSLGLLTESASQVVLRADEGLGEALEILRIRLRDEARVRRHQWESQARCTERESIDTSRVSKPMLHPSWYVGDGLLLSPREALFWSMTFCRDMLDVSMEPGGPTVEVRGSVGLHHFLGERGAHAVALRTTSVYTSMALSACHFVHSSDGASHGGDFLPQQQETVKALAERSLGGSGNGITSTTIDSQLAVSFLLSLPLKVAFKAYRASLPTAITKRDFTRVITIANIGVKAGSGDIGWKNQDIFVSQCRRLSSRARWWDILKFYQVEFDPSRFEEDDPLRDGDDDDLRGGSVSVYVASLIPEVISKASIVHRSTDRARSFASQFAKDFGLDPVLAAQKHIEFVLLPQKYRGWDLNHCERAARDSLRLMSSPMKRSAVLRRCVIALESANEYDTDYERHALVLSLYHGDLSLVLAKDPNIRDMDASAFEEELEFIERRRDALAILSSYFQGDKKKLRPSFPRFFLPLKVPFDVDRDVSGVRPPRDIVSLLDGNSSDAFDPLAPLQDFLSFYMDDAAAKALAPLTIPLGLPHGSIHVRCLVEHFRRFKDGKATLPSFEDDVLPVLNRLKRSSDQSRLSEYCAAYYDNLDPQKLQCLDYGLRYAMAASSEVEQHLRLKTRSDNDDLAAEERRALDAVKRLSDMHSALSDRIEVNGILSSATVGSSQQFSSVEKAVRDLTDRLQENFWQSANPSPEKFVETLLFEASLLASNACLDKAISFTINQFRHMASIVHQACKKIADQYSHVHPGDISRGLARRWLIHGEVSGVESAKSRSSDDIVDRSRTELSLSVAAVEDDTVDFVMDLKEAKAVWSDDIGSGLSKAEKPTTVSMEEEPSALKHDGSSREASEIDCAKVALRVAFVMSFAQGYHKSHIGDSDDEENSTARANSDDLHKVDTKKSRRGLLSRISTKDSSANSTVTAHARELLRIVFAKSGDSTSDPSTAFISMTASSIDDRSDETRKTLTFGMRYRALRTAAVLCPQVALDKVIFEEGYLNNSIGEVECSLKRCTYGAYVAKEIEEMGLPLPHSDLVQLSTMHFPSYARALWRHHRDGDVRGNQGRLLLLLLEMSLRDNTDCELAATLLNEMAKLKLPRSLLLGCECVARFKLNAVTSQPTSLLRDKNDAVSNSVFTMANLILKEVHRILASPDWKSQDLEKSLPTTMARVGALVEIFSDGEVGQRQLCQFVQVLTDLISIGNESFSTCLAETALSAIHCVSNVQVRKELLYLLGEPSSGQSLTQHRGDKFASDESSQGKGSPTVWSALSKVEASYRCDQPVSTNE